MDQQDKPEPPEYPVTEFEKYSTHVLGAVMQMLDRICQRPMVVAIIVGDPDKNQVAVTSNVEGGMPSAFLKGVAAQIEKIEIAAQQKNGELRGLIILPGSDRRDN